MLYRAGPHCSVPYRQTLYGSHGSHASMHSKFPNAPPLQIQSKLPNGTRRDSVKQRARQDQGARGAGPQPKSHTQTTDTDTFPVRPACLIWRYLTTMPKGGLRKSPALSASEHLRSTPGSESQNRNRNKFWRYHVSMACWQSWSLPTIIRIIITASKSSEGLERR